MKNTLLFTLLIMIALAGRSAIIDTVVIHSDAMRKSFKCVVVSPEQKKPAYPVVYLLHGYSGNFSNWITRVPELARYADQYQLIIVCPDGGYSSWYFDSPIDSTMRYETYIASEVPAYIDTHYPTVKNHWARAITGLSMGGHGGLFLGFRHPDQFGACGSMSGGVDLYSSRNRFDIAKRIGDTASYPGNWITYSVMNVIEQYPHTDSIAIIFDCGTEDFFYQGNHALHEKMLRLKIPHDYTERPGQHNWDYWRNSLQYQLLFFNNYFLKMQQRTGMKN